MRDAIARAWQRPVGAGTLARVSVASLVMLFVVVTSGAFVRLTASGLGCEKWPRCGDTPVPTEVDGHAIIEFGNRLVALVGIVLTLLTWLAARRTDGLPRFARLAALGTLLGAVAQIPLGGVTVILDLHPLAVMSHFLLAIAVVAVAAVVVIEAWSLLRGRADPVGPRWLRRLVTWVGIPGCVALVVTGAVATASGPHPGAAEGVERLGLEIADTVYVHVRVAGAFGIGFLLLGWFLLRERRDAPGVLRVWGVLLVALVAQAVLGEVQYRNALPWGLVLVHVFLAATIWTLSVVLAYVMWRPPRALVAAAGARVTRQAPDPRPT